MLQDVHRKIRRDVTRLSLVVLSLVVILAVLCGCGARASVGKATPRPTPAGKPNVLRWWGNYGGTAPPTLDPALATDRLSLATISLIYSNLVKVDYPSLKIVPDLATWTVSPNGATYTFHLRGRARFSSGDPVTAEDVAWSLTRALLPHTASPVSGIYLGDIQGADKVARGAARTLKGLHVLGPHTVRITLTAPAQHFLAALSNPVADVLDRRMLQGMRAGASLSKQCADSIGSGPFKLVCRPGIGPVSSGERSNFIGLTYVPNPYYFGRKPRITIIGPFYRSTQDTFRAYLKHDLDGSVVPASDYEQARHWSGFSRAGELNIDYLVPNVRLPPFRMRACRLAVAYAIDRTRITEHLLRGTAGPLTSVLPPAFGPAGARLSDVPSYNPAAARRYLKGCPGHLQHVELTYDRASPDLTREYEAIAVDLRAIGTRIALRGLPFRRWLDFISGEGTHAARTHPGLTQNVWTGYYPDPHDWLQPLLHSGGLYNIGGFSSPRLDALLERADRTRDRTTRLLLQRQAAAFAIRQGAVIPVSYPYSLAILSPRVHGMINTVDGLQPRHNDWANVSVR